MATITQTTISGTGAKAVTVTTLGASDTLTYDANGKQMLLIYNGTAGAITPNIVGDGATSVTVKGIGSVDVSGGYTFPSIAVGAAAEVILTTIGDNLTGTIDITAGDGAEAMLMDIASA